MYNNKNNNTGTAVATAREVYEGKVAIESVARAGKNPQLKGIVHEVMVKDAINLAPQNIINGTKATLSKSSTAIRDDIITTNAGKVIGRMQLKDTAQSIGKTVKQVSNGKYAGTNLVGTNETAEVYKSAVEKLTGKGVNVTQKMTSSGISSSDTARIATKAIGNSAGKLVPSAVGKAAASSGAAGALISGGFEAVSSGIKLANGEIDGEQFATNVANEAVGGAISAAAGTAAATVTSAVVSTAVASTAGTAVLGAVGMAAAAPFIAPVAAIGATIAVGGFLKDLWDNA